MSGTTTTPLAAPTPQRIAAAAAEATSRRRLLARATLVAGDVLMLVAALLAAYWVRFDLRMTLAPEVEPVASTYMLLGAALIPVWLLLFSIQGLYELDKQLDAPQEFARVFHACGTGSMILVLLHFLDDRVIVARGWVVGVWALSIVFVAGLRGVRRLAIHTLRERGTLTIPTLVVGTNDEAQTLVRQLTERKRSGRRVLGMIAAGDDRSSDALGGVNDIARIAAATGAREVIVAASAVQRDELLAVFEQLQPMPGIKLRLSSGFYEFITAGVEVGTTASIPLITVRRFRLSSREAAAKAAVETALTAIGIVALAPLFAVLALLVKLDSPGPIIFRRRVVGVNGVEFDAFKFRTMYEDADARLAASKELSQEIESEGKIKRDPRITRLGRVLRRLSLDELPQLFNVLRGEMSLVGPRMITAAEAEKYGPYRANLMTVKPGITGLWQVSGRSDLGYAERVQLDMHYIRNHSLLLDLYILFVQTPGAVLSGRGAY